METYTGYYQIPELKLNLQVKIELGRLVAESAGRPSTVLLAERDDYFYSEEANGYLLFKKGADGKVNEMMVEQVGRSLSAKRYTPSWGLTGSATTKGWVDSIPDITFTEDSVRKGYWIIKNITLTNGEIKFRFNNDWNHNYGDNDNDGVADLLGSNIKVTPGNYDIILDLTNNTRPFYTMKKNN